MRRIAALALIITALTGCATFPELDTADPTSREAYPALLPLDEILATAAEGRITDATGAGLLARVAALRARAAAMRGPVHDPATRARLAEVIAAYDSE